MSTRAKATIAMKRRLRRAFRHNLGIGSRPANAILKRVAIQDKAYELTALIATMKRIRHAKASTSFQLKHGPTLYFRSGGGPIDRSKFSYIEVVESGIVVAELWVDIEFLAISAPPGTKSTHKGHLLGLGHELDVVLVRPGTTGYPEPHEILIGVEAKNTPFTKALLKELLGVRREMAMLSRPQRLIADEWFVWWATDLPSHPPSGLVAFCSNANISKYDGPMRFWGIEMAHVAF